MTRLLSILSLAILVCSFTNSFATYTPVALTGFNADVVADIAGNANGSTTADYDGVNYVWMSSTYNPAGPSYLPNGGLITSVVASTPGLTYQLQPYTANNTLRLPGTSNGTLNFVTPQSAMTVFVLGSTGSGVGTATITITFTDLTTQVFTGIVFPDWYGGANFAIQGAGRTNRVTNTISNDPINPRLYQAPLALLASNYGKLIQSVSFSNTGGVLNIMAISIDTPPNPCTGTPVAGTATATVTNPCPATSVSVSLSGSSTASNLAYQWLQGTNCTGPWVSISGLSNPSAITPLLTVTTIPGSTIGYRCRITCTNSGLFDTSSTACVVTQPWTCSSTCYGTSTATSASDQDILNVTMGTLNNTTTCANPLSGSQGNGVGVNNMYSNFSNGVPAPIVYKGLSQPFSLTIGTCGASVNTSVKIYIDFNHNTLFTDPGEEVYSNTAIASVSPSAIVSGSFVVPIGANLGCTRMRVVMMSTSGGAITPTGSYTNGETEDYSINITTPGLYDPAISLINVPSGTCFSHNETVSATLCNYGTGIINTATNNITVTLNVTGPTGILSYPVTISSGSLDPYGATCLPITFTGVDLYNGGGYSINTSLTISGLSNSNLSNDSLSSPIVRTNYRPSGGPTYNMCQGGIIPFGQGLTVSGCATPVLDSVVMNFTLSFGQPPICSSTLAVPTNSCEFAYGTLPTLPVGSSFTGNAVFTVDNLASAFLGCVVCTWPSEKRFSLFSGIAPPSASSIFYPGVLGNTATTGSDAQGYTYTNTISPTVLGNIYSALGAGGTLKVGSWNVFNTTTNNHVINYNGNPTHIKLKIYYTYVPASFEWYKDSVGGSVLYTYSPFNPIGVPGSNLLNSNTSGVWTYYAACAGSSTCRVPVDLQINPTPVVIQDTLTRCEYAVGSNAASFDLNTIAGYVSAFNPGVSVNFFGDQGLFVPILNTGNDSSSSNYIYSKVTYTATGCYSSDTILLNVNAIPQFTSSTMIGNACSPSSIDVASLINPFSITAGADTLYYEDPLLTIPHPNPHTIFNSDTVYVLLKTNTVPSCSDTAMAIIQITPATNYIVNQDTSGNFSICGTIGCANLILGDGVTETLYSPTDCRKIAKIHDLTNGTSLGSTSICEDIDCGVQYHNGQPYVDRHYQISPSLNDSAEVCLYYLEDDFASFNATVFGSSWPTLNPYTNLCITQVDQGDITTPGHTAISIPNSAITATYDPLTTVWQICFKVDSFSYFYCNTCNPLNIPLPISLLNFTGQKVRTQVDLNWVTSNEQNNHYFILERSRDSKNFAPISSKIESKASGGNSTSPLTYSYVDSAPINGHNYYRLQQFDIDGEAHVSRVVDVFMGGETNVEIYPNPVQDALTVFINASKQEKVIIRLSDATGRTVRTIETTVQEGSNKSSIDLKSISSGIYQITLVGNLGLTYTQTIRKD